MTIPNLMGTCGRHFHWNSSRQISRNSSKTLHDRYLVTCMYCKHCINVLACAHVGDSIHRVKVAHGAAWRCHGLERWLVVWKIYWTASTRWLDKLWRTQTSQKLPVQGSAAASISRSRGRPRHAPLLLSLHPHTPHSVKSARLHHNHRQPCISEPRFVHENSSRRNAWVSFSALTLMVR